MLSRENITDRPTNANPADVPIEFNDSRADIDRLTLEKASYYSEFQAQARLIGILILIALGGASSDIVLSLVTGSYGSSVLTPMAQSNSVALVLLLISGYIFRAHSRHLGKVAFYGAILASFAGHAFWVGYGLSTPGLSFVALLLIQEALGPRKGNVLRPFAFGSFGLIGLIAVAQASGRLQTVPVPLEHQMVVTIALFASAWLLGRAILGSRGQASDANIENTLRQSELNRELSAALVARNSFFSAISHEMRTPLHGIQSAVSLINHPRTQPDAKARYVQSIGKSVTDLTRIIDDVLDLSRLESGAFTLQPESVDLRQLCAQQVELFKAAAEEKRMKIELRWSPETASTVVADGVRLRQMISNLLSNAIKFTSGGSVVFEVDRLQKEAGKTVWRFTFTDTGCGIDQLSLNTLFKPFAQAKNQQRGGPAGSGLGLSIVAGLARQMGGDVGVTSVLGQGSCFWFTVQLDGAMPEESSRVA